MGFPLDLALRYMRSRKRAFVSVGTVFAVLGVALGVAALATVMSVTGGFRAQFREKVLGVNAHVLVLKYTSDFREYRDVMKQMESVPGVIGIAPFVINPMMVTHGDHTATGVLLKGVDPTLMPSVLDLPRVIVAGDKTLSSLRLPGAKPPQRRKFTSFDSSGGTTGSNGKSGFPKAFDKPGLGEVATDAGNVPLLKAIHDALEGDDGGAAIADAGTRHGSGLALRDGGARRAPAQHDPTDAGASDDDGDDDLELPAGAPVGEIEPDGGYSAELPDDDEDDVPPDFDPDPCKDAAAVARLPGIVVGVTLKQTLGVELGDCVQVTSPTIGYTYSKGAIRAPVAKQFRVIAVFDAGFDQYDSKLVYTDLYEAQGFADAGDSVTGVEMKVRDIERAADVAQDVEARLQNGIYNIVDWEELNHGLFTALRIQQILMSIVLALIIVVAAFTVIATLIMVVLDKKKEIAVLKAMGASDLAMLRSFLYQGGIIGLLGTTLGLGLGLAVCKWILIYGIKLDPKVYFISRLPVQIRPGEFLFTGAFAILVCVIATVWPALYAARLRPADAFREQ